MKVKISAWEVVAVILIDGIVRHSDDLTQMVIDSELTDLGRCGSTPKRTLNSQLNTKRRNEKLFDGSSGEFWLLCDTKELSDEFDLQSSKCSEHRKQYVINEIGIDKYDIISGVV